MHSMIRLLHWISRNTKLALFKKVCNMILLMASFCVCYKRHTSLSERRFCRSYSLDIMLIRAADSQCSAQTESRVQTNLAELSGSYRWLLEQTFPSYSRRHVVLFGDGWNRIRGSVFWFQHFNIFIAWHRLLRFIWDTLIFAV